MDEQSENRQVIVCDSRGAHLFATVGGYIVFLQGHFTFQLEMKVAKDLGLTGRADSFHEGMRATEKFQNSLRELSNEFCEKLQKLLYQKGFRITWELRDQQILKDGTKVGPGPALFLKLENGSEENACAPHTLHKQAIKIGNDMNFRDGMKVTVEDLLYGIYSGGPILDAVEQDPKNAASKALVESFGLGRDYGTLTQSEFGEMRAKVEVLWKKMVHPHLRPDQEQFQRECEGLMKELFRRMVACGKRNDVELWMDICEEIGAMCPPFRRLTESEKTRIYQRVKVRLGLEPDEI